MKTMKLDENTKRHLIQDSLVMMRVELSRQIERDEQDRRLSVSERQRRIEEAQAKVAFLQEEINRLTR